MNIFIGFLIGILLYSFILTIVIVYKDISSYFSLEIIDIIIAGPIAWILVLIMYFIIQPLYKLYNKNNTKTPPKYKKKNKKYIDKVVKKIVKNYSNKKYHNDYFDFTHILGSDYNEYSGWEDLLVKKPKYERLNNKFKKLMYHQETDTIAVLITYFDLVTEEIMNQDNCDTYYIAQYKNKNLYKLR